MPRTMTTICIINRYGRMAAAVKTVRPLTTARTTSLLLPTMHRIASASFSTSSQLLQSSSSSPRMISPLQMPSWQSPIVGVSAPSSVAKYYSTKPSHKSDDPNDRNNQTHIEKSSSSSSSSTSTAVTNTRNPIQNQDPLQTFYERREAMNRKQQEQQQQQQNANTGHTKKPSSHRPWLVRANSTNMNDNNGRTEGEGSKQQSPNRLWNRKRYQPQHHGQNSTSSRPKNFDRRIQNNNDRNIRDNRNLDSPRPPQRQQHQQEVKSPPPKNSTSQGTSKLTELIKQLEQSGRHSIPPSNNNNENSKLDDTSSTPSSSSRPWRDSFQRRTSNFNDRNDIDYTTAQQRNRRPPSSRIHGRDRFGRFPSRHQQQHQQQQNEEDRSRRAPPSSDEFLFGRLSRKDQEESQEIEASAQNQSQQHQQQPPQRRSVTLPATSLTLTEASALFRVKVDDIQQKALEIGLIQEQQQQQQSTTTMNDTNTELSTSDDDDGTSSSTLLGIDEYLLDVDALELLAMEYDIDTTRSAVDESIIADSEQLLMNQRRSEESLTNDDDSEVPLFPPRPPVVSVMGHVDHGKTTLMDALRRLSMEQQQQGGKKKKKKSKKAKKVKNGAGGNGDRSGDVAGTEAGGITQVISAFQVPVEGYDDGMITFLDTPGHAAFSAMRQSGSHAADVIVLVIAADDGVSPQTVEILNMYKSIVQGSSAGGISMVVALNKIDKPGIDVDEAKMRIENQLLEHGIMAEGMDTADSEFGQPVQVIPTSGLTGLGLDDLTEGLMLQSEVMDLRADDEANAEGIVMDARMEKGLGVVADCIIRRGKIEKGSVVMSGDQVARVRMLKDVSDKMLKVGLPSQPVRIVGFKDLPKAGDPIVVVESEEAAEEIISQRLTLNSSSDIANSDRPDADRSDVSLQIHGMRRGDSWRVRKVHEKASIEDGGNSIRVPVIVKADADGSLSAIRDSLVQLGDNTEVHDVIIDPISESIGEITMSDIQMAKESDATIFAFGLSRRIDQSTINLAEAEGVTICSNDIIYSLLDKAKEILGRHLPPTEHEHVHGRALVQAVFTIDTSDGKEQIAGLRVIDGNLFRDKAKSPDASSSSETSPLLNCEYRVFRDGKQIAPDPDNTTSQVVTASSLRKFKELVDSVRMGEECGLGLDGFSDFKDGDEIECYSVEMKSTTL